jgi:delta-aminolevulinic acid dehydratase/porphobilinogen synthase
MPIFVMEGENSQEAIPSMPGFFVEHRFNGKRM